MPRGYRYYGIRFGNLNFEEWRELQSETNLAS